MRGYEFMGMLVAPTQRTDIENPLQMAIIYILTEMLGFLARTSFKCMLVFDCQVLSTLSFSWMARNQTVDHVLEVILVTEGYKNRHRFVKPQTEITYIRKVLKLSCCYFMGN